jgi:hypothetical protein
MQNTSYQKATDLGIRSARLPIKETTGEEYANLSLCVNQGSNRFGSALNVSGDSNS